MATKPKEVTKEKPALIKKSEGLAVKYRPRKFSEVVGQGACVKALKNIIDRGSAQAFLFVGPSGVGKTTLARIAAHDLGVEGRGLIEVDAATNTGIDNMRAIRVPLDYKPFQGESRAIIVDEAHMLSKSAWNSLLKAVEEPTGGVYWFFCTTEAAKIPATIKTRTAAFTLALVGDKDLGALYDEVCDEEGIKLSGDVGDLIIREAHGSPRQLLMNLAVCEGVETKREAAALLQTVAAQDQVIELCRFLVKGGSWSRGMSLIGAMGEDANAESVRIVACNFLAACIRGAKSERDVPRLLNILDAFSVPYNQSEKMAPLYLSLGRVLFSN